MTENTLTAGSDVDSHCLKCKGTTNHTIIAMTDGVIAKVVCNTCNGRHNYRPPKTGHTALKSGKVMRKADKAAKKKATPKAKVSLKEKKAAANFEARLSGRDLGEAKPYSMTGTFEADDLINHPTFGIGYVNATIPPNKIEVSFQSSTKILIATISNELVKDETSR